MISNALLGFSIQFVTGKKNWKELKVDHLYLYTNTTK